MDKRNLGIDFDGVILDFFLHRSWQPTNHFIPVKSKNLGLEAAKVVLGHLIRTKKIGVNDFLQKAKDEYDEIHLITSRGLFAKPYTLAWLSKQGLDSFFTEYHFLIDGQTSLQHKANSLKANNCSTYIDDDRELLSALATTLPKIQYYLFSSISSSIHTPSSITHISSFSQIPL